MLREESVQEVQQLRPFINSGQTVWINVEGLGDAGAIQAFGELLRLHPLALEDVLNVHQRAKVEDYQECLFIVARMVHQAERLESEQISIFLGKNYVLTFQERRGDCLEPVRERIRKGKGGIRGGGAPYLATPFSTP